MFIQAFSTEGLITIPLVTSALTKAFIVRHHFSCPLCNYNPFQSELIDKQILLPALFYLRQY